MNCGHFLTENIFQEKILFYTFKLKNCCNSAKNEEIELLYLQTPIFDSTKGFFNKIWVF